MAAVQGVSVAPHMRKQPNARRTSQASSQCCHLHPQVGRVGCPGRPGDRPSGPTLHLSGCSVSASPTKSAERRHSMTHPRGDCQNGRTESRQAGNRLRPVRKEGGGGGGEMWTVASQEGDAAPPTTKPCDTHNARVRRECYPSSLHGTAGSGSSLPWSRLTTQRRPSTPGVHHCHPLRSTPPQSRLVMIAALPSWNAPLVAIGGNGHQVALLTEDGISLRDTQKPGQPRDVR